MLCDSCGVFQCRTPTPPCAVCRTWHRIGYFLRTGHLHPGQEQAVLTALRVASSTVQDLAEESTGVRFPAGRLDESVPKPTGAVASEEPSPKAPGSEEKPEEKPEERKKVKEKEKAAKRDRPRKDRKVSGKKKKSRSRERKEADTEEKAEEPEDPKSGRASPEPEEKSEVPQGREEEEAEEKKEEDHQPSSGSGLRPSDRVVRRREEEAGQKEAYLEEWRQANPPEGELRTPLPVHGSAAKAFRLTEAPSTGSLRPAEPKYPPRKDGGGTERPHQRERSRSIRRIKTPKQRERERDRARTWRESKAQKSQWRQK